MRALLIDPFKREMREVDVPAGFEAIQQFVAAGALGEKRVPFSSGPRLSPDTICWVDDEGIFRPDQAWFRIAGYSHPLAGFMLIQGSDGPNEVALPAWMDAAMLEPVLHWITPELARQMVQPMTIHTLGPDMQPDQLVEVIEHDMDSKRPIR